MTDNVRKTYGDQDTSPHDDKLAKLAETVKELIGASVDDIATRDDAMVLLAAVAYGKSCIRFTPGGTLIEPHAAAQQQPPQPDAGTGMFL